MTHQPAQPGLPTLRALAAGLLALSVWQGAHASGQGEPMDLFFTSRFADVPLSQHWQQPGGLHTDRHLPYLVLAYWRWGGAPAQPELGAAIDQLIGPLTPLAAEGDPAQQGWSAAQAWLERRQAAQRTLGLLAPAAAASAASGVQPQDVAELAQGRELGDLSNGTSCYASTFDKARETLDQRLREHGQETAALKHWLAMQDWVLSQCTSPPSVNAPDLPKAAPLWLAHDHAWQMAASLFHADHLDTADQAYRAIQADAASPWRQWAAYMRLRVMLRRGSEGVSAKDVDTLAQQLLAEPALAELHPSVRRLRLTWHVRQLPPERRVIELAKGLAQPGQPHETAARLLLLGDALRGWRYAQEEAAAEPAGAASAAARAQATPEPELLQWLNAAMAFHSSPAQRSQAALAAWQKYQAQHHLAWLLLATHWLPANHPMQAAAQAALAAIPAQHPAAYAARLNQAQHAWDVQDLKVLAALSRDLLARPQTRQSPSEFNMVAALSLPTASDWASWMRLALRRPIARTDPENTEPGGTALVKTPQVDSLDHDVVQALNVTVPLSLWLDLAAHPTLSPRLRRDLLESGWTRAVLAQRLAQAREFTRRLIALGPDANTPLLQAALKLPDDNAAWTRLLVQRLVSPRDTVGRAYLAADEWSLPTLPALNDIPVRDSPRSGDKWCALPAAERSASLQLKPLAFTSPEQHQAQAQDLAQWFKLPTDSIWLAQQAMALRAVNKRDPLVPEALALAVRLSRHACASPELANSSRAALALLQREYGHTAAAQGTQYWHPGR